MTGSPRDRHPQGLHPEGIGATMDHVLDLLARDFPTARHAELGALLATVAEAPGVHGNGERVQVACLLAAEGDEERLWQFVDLAHVDYRDVLVAAFYPDA